MICGVVYRRLCRYHFLHLLHNLHKSCSYDLLVMLGKDGEAYPISSCKLRTSLMAVLNCSRHGIGTLSDQIGFQVQFFYECRSSSLPRLPHRLWNNYALRNTKWIGKATKNIPTIIEYTKTIHLLLYNKFNYARILIGSHLWSIEGQITPIRIYHSSAVMGGRQYIKGDVFHHSITHFRSAETQSTSE